MTPKLTAEAQPDDGMRYLEGVNRGEYIGRTLLRTGVRLEVFIMVDPRCSPAVRNGLKILDAYDPHTTEYKEVVEEGQAMVDLNKDKLAPLES
jgi:hypothetical protein